MLVGVPTPEGLTYAGRVGSGIGAKQSDLLARALTEQADSPFGDEVPRIDATGTIWTAPQVVVDVTHLGKTDVGRLRQPVFRGIRTDLAPADLHDDGTAEAGGDDGGDDG